MGDPLLLIPLGFLVGILVGMTGMGGAALLTPVLILLGVPPVTAVGTDIFQGAVMKTVGAWRHIRLRTVNFTVVLWLALGSVPGAIFGVRLLDLLKVRWGNGVDDIVTIALAAAVILVGASVVVKAIRGPMNLRLQADTEYPRLQMSARRKVLTVMLGLATGFVVGVTSVGSGVLIAMLLITVYRLLPKRVVGTDVVHAAVLLCAAGIVHGFAGNVNFLFAGALLVGSIPGVWLGAGLSVRMSANFLRSALGVILVWSSLGLLRKVGVPVPLGVLIATPVALSGVLWLRHVLHVRGMDRHASSGESAGTGTGGGAGDRRGGALDPPLSGGQLPAAAARNAPGESRYYF